MQAEEVADVTVGLFGALLPNWTVGLEIMYLRCPAPLTGATDTMTATVAAAGAAGGEPGRAP